nr:zinc finger, CCHC-type [Tanacetum cinerariifolium]
MLRLQGLGSNTPTGVPYTEDEIMAIARGGKQRGHIPGVGQVLPGQGTVIPPPSQGTHLADDIARLKKREKLLTKQVNMFMSGSGGCEDDEPGDDEDGGEDEEEEDDRIVAGENGKCCSGKRNYPQYLAELLKKKKNAASRACGSGLRASRKLKPGALSLYVGNGQREAVEAIDAFIYVSLDGFVNCFVDNTIQVYRNNMVYFSDIPRDGIFEIDLSNSLTNESSIHVVSNKRAKPDLESALLWHCRLGHISKKRIEKLQHIMSRQRASYFVTFTDDFSRYGYVYLLKHKHEVFETFKVFQKEVENQLGKTIKSLHFDRGGEYMSQEFLEHLKGHGIIARRTPPYTPQHNGVSERRNKTLLDMVRFMMSQTTLPKSFWDYALETAGYEALVKRDTLTKPDKLEIISVKCIFVGYPKKTMGYSFYYQPKNKVLVTRNAEFLENSLINQEASGSVEDLEIIQEEDTHPSIDSSLNHEEDDLEIDEPQSDIIPIRRSTRTRHAPDHNEFWVLVELPPNGKTIGSKWLFKKKTNMDGNEKLKLSKSQGASTPAELKRMQNVPYASTVGSIMYVVRCIRPDVANTKDMFLVYGGDLIRELRVSCYTDAGYLTDADDLKSQTGYVFVLNGGAVDWKSTKQSIFATSSAEAEYIAAFDASKEAVWVRKFISGLGVVAIIEEPINMYYDNTRAISIANESGITKGARHFRAKVHYLRKVIEYGDIKLEKVHTNDNLADPFTKALAFLKHLEHTRNIGMLPASSLIDKLMPNDFVMDGVSGAVLELICSMRLYDRVEFVRVLPSESIIKRDKIIVDIHIAEQRVQQARLQTLKSEYEILHMKEDETIDTFTEKFTTLVNKAASLGHTIEDQTIVRKLLNVVPDRYLQIVASIEQYSDLSKMTMEEAIERLKTYEERIKYKKDNGASNHMTGVREHFKELDEKVSGKVRFGDGSYIKIKGKVMKDDELRLYDMDYKIFMKVTLQRNRLYKASLRIVIPVCPLANLKDDTWLWHTRLGHLNFESLKSMAQKDLVQGIHAIKHTTQICDVCLIEKHSRAPFSKRAKARSTSPLDLVYGDLCGPISPLAPFEKKYIFLLVDDYSRYMWVYFLNIKDQAFDTFKKYKKTIENKLRTTLKMLRTDRGGEFTSNEFTQYCKENGIARQLIAPYSPQQNGIVKRRNKTIMSTTRFMMKAMNMPQNFWAEAVRRVIYILNSVPTKALEDITPYEAIKRRKPYLEKLRVFGCIAYAKVPSQWLTKLDDRSIRMVYLGNEQGSKAY